MKKIEISSFFSPALLGNNLLLLVIFCLPLYLVRLSLFSLPTNVLEIFAIAAIIFTFLQKKAFLLSKLSTLPKIFILGAAFVLAGVVFSLVFNNPTATGLGILKSWFVVPMLFSFAFYLNLGASLTIEKAFGSIYFSAATVGAVAILYKIFEITTYDNRLAAFYLSPNQLAMYLTPGIFFGLYFLLKSLRGKFFKQTVLHLFLLFLLTLPLYFTYSYGAWLALAVSFLLLILLSSSSKKRVLFIFSAISLCGFLLFVSQKDSPKFNSLLSTRSSTASRITIWQVALRLINEKPVLGIGPGNFQDSYLSFQKYYPPYLEWAVPQPHNIFLAFWLQAGLIGFIGFIAVLSSIFHIFWRLFRDKKNTVMAAPLFGFFLYTVLHGLLDTTYWKNDLAFLFWLGAFLVIYLYEKSYRTSK